MAFKPTGWTFSQEVGVENIQPQIKDNISVYGMQFISESFSVLKASVWLIMHLATMLFQVTEFTQSRLFIYISMSSLGCLKSGVWYEIWLFIAIV